MSANLSNLFENFENILEPKECELIKASEENVPSYLKGTMVRNGPGMFEIGATKYNHWFDGLAYMQRYNFEDGKMFYSARFLESESYMENMSRNRIVRSSFGTGSFSDPCKTLYSSLSSTFEKEENNEREGKHDNANVAFTPIGDQVYACTETPHMYKIDLETLGTGSAVDISKLVNLHNCTAHQIVDYDGNVFNIGSTFGKDSFYVFTKTTPPQSLSKNENGGQNDWEETIKIGEIPCTDPLNPTYMHSFGMSENFLVMFESPVRISMKKLIKRKEENISFRECISWDDKLDVNVFILNKKTGERNLIKYTSAPFFTFHHANTFEKDGCLVVDYCRMEKAGNFDKLLIENMKAGNFSSSSATCPYLTRMIIPLEIPINAKPGDDLLQHHHHQDWTAGCSAVLQADGSVHLVDHKIADIPLEFPRFHLEKFNMKEYKYCYGSSMLGALNSPDLIGIVKINVANGQSQVWKRENHFQLCGEPIFVPHPEGIDEDDGVLIVPVMTASEGRTPFVLILDAKNVREIARYNIPEKRIPLGFHAFYKSKQF